MLLDLIVSSRVLLRAFVTVLAISALGFDETVCTALAVGSRITGWACTKVTFVRTDRTGPKNTWVVIAVDATTIIVAIRVAIAAFTKRVAATVKDIAWISIVRFTTWWRGFECFVLYRIAASKSEEQQ